MCAHLNTVFSKLGKISWWQGLLILAPLWGIASSFLFGLLHPHYSLVRQHISELGARDVPYALWMNSLGLLPFSVMLFSGSIGLFSAQKKARPRFAYGFFVLSALCFVLVAIFPCDYGCPWRNVSAAADIHNFSAVLAFLSGLGAQIFLGSLYAEHREDRYYLCCLLCGLSSILLYILVDITSIPDGNREMLAYKGLAQRAFMANYFLWLLLTALRSFPRGAEAADI